jgi:hypothetical protein
MAVRITRLPDLTGELGGTSVSGARSARPAQALMRHCEFYVLTCTITMVSRDDRAQLEYAGVLKRVELNGFYDDARSSRCSTGPTRASASTPALDLDIQGWPQAAPGGPLR